jgi:hypothetical protein
MKTRDEIIAALSDKIEDEQTLGEVGKWFDEYEGHEREVQEGYKAKTDEMSALVAAQKEEIKTQKARNYDLLMQVPSGDDAVQDKTGDDGEVLHFSSLFEEVK